MHSCSINSNRLSREVAISPEPFPWYRAKYTYLRRIPMLLHISVGIVPSQIRLYVQPVFRSANENFRSGDGMEFFASRPKPLRLSCVVLLNITLNAICWQDIYGIRFSYMYVDFRLSHPFFLPLKTYLMIVPQDFSRIVELVVA